MREDSALISSSRLWVRRFAIAKSLDPFDPLEGRDVPLHRGLNIVWGLDSGGSAEGLLAGHSVGKTLFCRLVRYGLGEKEYASDDFQQQVEAVLPEAYLSLEVVVNGTVWSVLRPLCRRKSIGKGTPRQDRHDFAGAADDLKHFAEQRRATSNFQGYMAALDGLADACLPSGLDSHERPFDWASLLQWFARDQEARYVDVMVLRSTRSRTARPLDQERSDMLVRSALGLADAAEARLSHQVGAKQVEIVDARRNNEKNRATMWAITQQLMLRHVGLEVKKPEQADGKQTALAADRVLENRIADIKPLLETAKGEYRSAQRAYDDAYDAWRPIELAVIDLEAQLTTRADTDKGFDQELKDLQALKAKLADHGHRICAYCAVIYDVACRDRLDEEEAVRTGTTQRREEARARRETARLARVATLDELRPERDLLKAALDAAAAERDAKKLAYDAQSDELRRLEAELADVQFHLAGVKAAEAGRAYGGGLPLIDTATLESELHGLEADLASLRHERQGNLDNVREAFDQAVRGVLSDKVSGNVTLDAGRLRFSLQNGRGPGDLVRTLTVILFDLSTLIMTINGDAKLPGLLIHDSPREADMQEHDYHKLLRFAHSLQAGADDPAFQYIVTTTTRPPEELQGPDVVVLTLSAETEDGLLLKKRIGE